MNLKTVIDDRADLYAIAVVLAEAATGINPFRIQGPNPVRIMKAMKASPILDLDIPADPASVKSPDHGPHPSIPLPTVCPISTRPSIDSTKSTAKAGYPQRPPARRNKTSTAPTNARDFSAHAQEPSAA